MDATEKPPERKSRTRLTFAQKVEALKRLEGGEKQIALAKELGCSRRALSRLKQNRNFFQQLQLKPSDSHRKSRHSVRNLALEASLTSFLSIAKRNGFPVTVNAVRHAALKIRDELLADPELSPSERASLRGFQASVNWSKAFVKRRGLRNIQVAQGEAGSQPQDTDTAQSHLKGMLCRYDLDCIVSFDKLNLFYKLLPTDLSTHSQPSARETETSKRYILNERVVVLAATNTTGSLKIPPTIVWKEKVPRCLDSRPCPLPHLYHPQAWVDDDVFKTWFYSVLLPAVRRYTTKKVALLVNEDWLHTEVSDSQGQVRLVALPRSEVRDQGPLSMGVISVLRRKYRYSMLDMVMRMLSSGCDGFQSGFGQLSTSPGLMDGHRANLLDLGDLLEGSWRSISDCFIGRCWIKCELLPEEHVRTLVDAYGRHAGARPEELYASCCTASQLENARSLERILLECQVVVPRTGVVSTRSVGLVNKLNNVGRRELDAWFEIEETARGLRALGSELDEIQCRVGSEIIVKKGMKRRAEEMMVVTESEKQCKKGLRNNLPSVGYLLDLVAPIEGILGERESAKAGQLVRSLKMELVRLKSEEELERVDDVEEDMCRDDENTLQEDGMESER